MADFGLWLMEQGEGTKGTERTEGTEDIEGIAPMVKVVGNTNGRRDGESRNR